MSKRLSAMLCALLVALCCVGCGGAATETEPAPAADRTQQQQETTAAEDEDAEEQPSPEGDQGTVARPSNTGALHVEGTHLVDKDGKTVVLRGISTHGLAWFPDYANAAMFQQLADWGANVVRLALYTEEYGGWCSGGNRDELRQLVLDAVEYATEADLYVIVDWHTLSDNNPATHQEEAIAFFDDVAGVLADHDNVIYEVCNEPNGATSWQDVRAYAQEVIPVVRRHAPEAVCLVGTPEWCQRPDSAAADPLDLDNVMYTVHFYAATHKQDLRDRTAQAIDAGLPVFVSEFGICDASGNGAIDEDEADAWMALLDELEVSRVMWNLSNKDESSAMISSACDKTSGLADTDLSQAGRWVRTMLDPSASMSEATSEDTVQAVDAEHADGQFSWRAKVVNSWQDGDKTVYQYELALTNQGDGVSSWKVTVPFDQDIELVDGWNASYAVEGSDLILTNADYNGSIAAGQTLADIGFQVKASGEPRLADEG